VRNLQKAAQLILEKHNGEFPTRYEDVLSLPGVGPYTAGAICSIAFNQPTPVLDGNVIRVLTRLFGIDGNPRDKQTNDQLWQLARTLVQCAASGGAIEPSAKTSASAARSHRPASALNQSLMELGALICTPRAPQCQSCPLAGTCVAFSEGRVDQLPRPGLRLAATRLRFVAFILKRRGRWLVRQRPAGVVNGHLWEFPNVEVNGSGQGPQRLKAAAQQVLGFAPATLGHCCTIKHSITRYRITLDAYHAHDGYPHRIRPGGRWLTRPHLERLAFASAHKKLLQRL
jgi:A/G-specific adenine glycosylase